MVFRPLTHTHQVSTDSDEEAAIHAAVTHVTPLGTTILKGPAAASATASASPLRRPSGVDDNTKIHRKTTNSPSLNSGKEEEEKEGEEEGLEMEDEEGRQRKGEVGVKTKKKTPPRRKSF